jgi:DUF4097 and DUF4098 domain-containing protein YvlB
MIPHRIISQAAALCLGIALALPAQQSGRAPKPDRLAEQIGKVVEKSIDEAMRTVDHTLRHLDRELGLGLQDDWRQSGQQGGARIDTTVAFPRDGVVDLSTFSGDITVTGWTRSEARIVASSERGQLRWRATSARITIETESARGRTGETRYELSVPEGVRVIMRTTSGDLVARGVRGPVDAHSSNGDIEVVDAAERVELETLNGDIRGSRLRGEVEATSVNGDVVLDDVEGRSVHVESTGGDLILANVRSRDVSAETVTGEVEYRGTIEAGGQYEFNSHSGDIVLTVPANVAARFSVETYSGEVDSDFPITLQPGQNRSQSRQLEFVLGGGGDARVIAETFSGDIDIRRVSRQ